MGTVFTEIRCEEIPARMQRKAREAFERLLLDGLKAAGLDWSVVQSHVTPRRIMVAIDGVPDRQPDLKEERKGPKADAPQRAIEGFLTSVGLTLDQVERRETKKGPVLFAVLETPGQDSTAVLPQIIADAVLGIPWPKSMRWSSGRLAFVRPLHGVVALFNGQPLSGGIRFGDMPSLGQATPRAVGYDATVTANDTDGVAFGAVTFGHRFMAPDAIPVSTAERYGADLMAAKVMVDAEARKRVIWEGAQAVAEPHGLTVKEDPGLLEEVAGLVEWPVPLIGRIDDAFMDVPEEVLVTSMRTHQKYFSVSKADGSLAPMFVVIANMETADGGAQIVAGNERVLRARLSDAKFFWDQDRATPLADRVEALGTRVFHAELGTDLQKVERVRALATWLSDCVTGADSAQVDRAALLAKADLTTEMVGEFPELQGLMGRYYAQLDGEAQAVADAIRDHYGPVGPSDGCPSDPVSICVALADKLDTLAGFWVIGRTPTGSKDPFALRRAALGVIRLIVENGLRVSLTAAITQASGPVVADAKALGGDKSVTADIADTLLSFFADRLKVQTKEKGVRHDLIEAVLTQGSRAEDDFVRLLARVSALATFLKTEDGANLLAAHKRAANIVRAEEKKDKGPVTGTVDRSIFVQAEETALAEALAQAEQTARPKVAEEDFTGAMAALAQLRGPVDAFLDQVTVNAEDPAIRANRLRLLAAIGSAMGHVANFSCIEG